MNEVEAEKELTRFTKKLGVREENEKEKLKLKTITKKTTIKKQ